MKYFNPKTIVSVEVVSTKLYKGDKYYFLEEQPRTFWKKYRPEGYYYIERYGVGDYRPVLFSRTMPDGADYICGKLYHKPHVKVVWADGSEKLYHFETFKEAQEKADELKSLYELVEL